MLAPRWMQVAVGIAVLNALLVVVSLIHRHRFAENAEPNSFALTTPPNMVGDVVGRSSPLMEDTEGSGVPSQTLNLIQPPIGDLNGTPKPVADDDPLMAEIRKQVASQFPDLATTVVPQSESTEIGTKQASPNTELTARLQLVRQLSEATQEIVQLSDELRLSGKTAEAEQLLLQSRVLQSAIRQLLD